MSVTQSTRSCRQCGYREATMLFDSHSREWEVSCYRCGFREEVRALRERHGKRPTSANRWKAPYVLRKDGYPKLRYSVHFGFGAYTIAHKDGGGEMNSFSRPVKHEQIESFRRVLENPDVDAARSYLSVWEDGQVRVVIGTLPEHPYWTGDEVGDEAQHDLAVEETFVPLSDDSNEGEPPPM